MKIDNLNKLISFLERLHPDNFDLSIIVTGTEDNLRKIAEQPEVHQCSTAGCVAGYIPAVFPEEFEWMGGMPHRRYNGRFVSSFVCLSLATGIHEDVAKCIVYEGYYSDRPVPVEAVIKRLKQVRSGEVTEKNYREVWLDEN